MTDNLQSLNHTDFEALLNTSFDVIFEDDTAYTLTLIEVHVTDEERHDPKQAARRSFSLIFSHPDTTRHLIQQTYQLQHDTLGTLTLFLVPLGIQDNAQSYEAIFT